MAEDAPGLGARPPLLSIQPLRFELPPWSPPQLSPLSQRYELPTLSKLGSVDDIIARAEREAAESAASKSADAGGDGYAALFAQLEQALSAGDDTRRRFSEDLEELKRIAEEPLPDLGDLIPASKARSGEGEGNGEEGKSAEDGKSAEGGKSAEDGEGGKGGEPDDDGYKEPQWYAERRKMAAAEFALEEQRRIEREEARRQRVAEQQAHKGVPIHTLPIHSLHTYTT